MYECTSRYILLVSKCIERSIVVIIIFFIFLNLQFIIIYI